jgi:hypothetical protein
MFKTQAKYLTAGFLVSAIYSFWTGDMIGELLTETLALACALYGFGWRNILWVASRPFVFLGRVFVFWLENGGPFIAFISCAIDQ